MENEVFLKQFLEDVVRIDLGFVGGRFTWVKIQGGQTLIRERLDKAVVDKDWLEDNPHACSGRAFLIQRIRPLPYFNLNRKRKQEYEKIV